MSLEPIAAHPNLFRDTADGQIVNIRDFKPREMLEPLNTDGFAIINPPPGEGWVIKNWCIVMDPLEGFDPGYNVRIRVGGRVEHQSPLFTFVRPVGYEAALEKRVTALENIVFSLRGTLKRAEQRGMWPVDDVVMNSDKSLVVEVNPGEVIVKYPHEVRMWLLVKGVCREAPVTL